MACKRSGVRVPIAPPSLFKKWGGMKIGIIGAGNIGGALTHRLTSLGYEVKVANSRGPETLKELSEATGAEAVTAADAVKGVDLIVITIPEKAVPNLPKGLVSNLPEDFPIVDTNNYYPVRDGKIDEIENGKPESVWVSEQLGHPVIKAFNNIYAQKLKDDGKPSGSKDRLALPVSGDNKKAKDIVMKLIDDIGFDPIDAGSLDESWNHQPGTPVYGTSLGAEDTKKGLADASPNRPKDFRA